MQPSPKAIELALTRATERFAAELAEPQTQAPTWNDFEWQMARAAAVLHGVTPMLSSVLRWVGPESWQGFLVQQRQQTELRHRRITNTLQEITDRAAAEGLAFVALKGAALHALGVYSAGERPMADIDLLVRQVDAERAGAILVSLGYVLTAESWKDQVFETAMSNGGGSPWAIGTRVPLGEHEAYPVKIELHTRVAERLPVTPVDITSLIFPKDMRPGLNPYRSTNILMLHLLLHAAGNLSNRALRLMHLHDIALLAATMSTTDWERLLSQSPSPKRFWWAFPPLVLLDRYQPGLVPPRVLNALRVACPWILRRHCRHSTLSQLSFASMSIPAFPQLAWCRSARELLRYLRHRLRPDQEHLATRMTTASELWAAPNPWSRRSQARRMLIWLFARPPRQAAMYIVELALRNPAS